MADMAFPAPAAPAVTATTEGAEHLDVVIVGAGLSGIGSAYHLQSKCPKKTYAILEARQAMGGTWDLFRYPGIRSDSDMHTLGYRFRPWKEAKAIADGPSILKYIQETAAEYGIDRKIRYGHRVISASWSTADGRWTVEATGPEGKPVRIICKFLFMCSGYYDYANGYMPGWPGMDSYRGRIVHPQKWPQDLDYAGKRVVVIGSGATAVTLVPAMATTAAHVVMLQRSPTYVVARPSEDTVANWIHRWVPDRFAHGMIRWKNVLLGMYFYTLCKRRPHYVKTGILRMVREQLGPKYDVDKHFTPSYKPWDQRLCLVPDSDLFDAIKAGKASVVTDEIETFTEKGIRTKSGEELQCDIIVTATGLNLKLLGGMTLAVDGKTTDVSQTMSYKGMMCSDIPNFAFTLGYTNASWTLKCDLTAEYVCRLLNYLDAQGYDCCIPRRNDPSVVEERPVDLMSGYVNRGIDKLPKQGSKRPWKLRQNYARDMFELRYATVEDGVMEFVRLPKGRPAVHTSNGVAAHA
jgi:cation diffusion facilitator CzcD-associated flavoprotein CzcO